MWYETSGGLLFGGTEGIEVSFTSNMIIPTSDQELITYAGKAEWKTKFTEERIISPIQSGTNTNLLKLQYMLDCNLNHLSLDQILASLLTIDANGNCSVRLIPVADGDAPYKDCDNNQMDNTALFKSIIGVDANNNLGIRVIEGNGS